MFNIVFFKICIKMHALRCSLNVVLSGLLKGVIYIVVFFEMCIKIHALRCSLGCTFRCALLRHIFRVCFKVYMYIRVCFNARLGMCFEVCFKVYFK